MASLKKPDSVEIIVRSRKKNKAKSFTIYGASVEEALRKIKQIFGKS